MIFIDEEKYKNLSGIYKIEQISTGRIYVGQTKMRFMKRYWHHRWKLNDNSHDNNYLQSCWNKYSADDFLFQVLHVLDKNADMNELEIDYIDKLRSFENGFNLTIGGEGKKGMPTSEYAKKIIGEKNRIHNLGKKRSLETRAKMSRSQKKLNRKLTPELKKKLIESRIGTKHTKESKQKMRETHLGSKNVVSKIDERQAFIIKNRLKNKEKIVDISDDMDIDYHIIKSILANRVWTHVEVDGWDDFLKKYQKTKKKLLSDDKVREIRKLLKKGHTAPYVAKQCDVGVNVVYGIKQGRTYKDVL